MKPRDIAASALCAALYAVIGYMSYLGIFTPAIGVVRFWPSVFIPASFAIIYGPLVGALGAAVGIFISDMLIHGNALLSLSVGVPANFIGFYIVGYLVLKLKEKGDSIVWVIAVGLELLIIALLVFLASIVLGLMSYDVAVAYAIGLVVTALAIVIYTIGRRKTPYAPLLTFSCSTGLLVGSIIIGLGVWLFSQYFVLPSGARSLAPEAVLLWMLWVYVTEIPFMIALTPITVNIAQRMKISQI